MTYSLRFLPEVEEDIIGGYVWYEAKSSGIGGEFWGRRRSRKVRK